MGVIPNLFDHLQYCKTRECWGNDVDCMGDVDHGGHGILQGRPWLDAWDIDVEDQDVEQHGEDWQDCARPQR